MMERIHALTLTDHVTSIVVGSVAATVCMSLILIQMDAVSRRVFSAERLCTKRQKDNRFRIGRAIASHICTVYKYIDNEYGSHDALAKCKHPVLVQNEDDMDGLVTEIMAGRNPTPLIVGITVDLIPEDRDSTEWLLHLAFPQECPDGNIQGYERIVKTPLVKFTIKLAHKFEEKLNSNTLCFVADASSGFGTHVLGKIVEHCQAGLVLVKEPAWMTTLAYLAEQNLIAEAKMELVIFGLCRLNAWAERKILGDSRTVVFTLPGQSCTAALLPFLQRVFPCERHVFTYDSCTDSVARGLFLRRHNHIPLDNLNEGHFLPIAMPRAITATTPISSLHNLKDYRKSLAKLPYNQADTIEAWMSSVDTFLTIKSEESTNGYYPFVCRMGFLTSQIGLLGNVETDLSDLALINVLQYITGSRSRVMRKEVVDAAKSALLDARNCLPGDTLRKDDRLAIEACVFVNKGIIIGDKMLLDTVHPKIEWSLKAARKVTSCVCCMMGESEIEEDEGGSYSGSNNRKHVSVDNGVVLTQTKYVDGKATLAFDPSQFTGIKL